MADSERRSPAGLGPAIWSYGFRPFFLAAALFAGVSVPIWVVLLIQTGDAAILASARDWHVHEMVFGFLPATITGFLLTALPNWTERPPIRGRPLILFVGIWLAGRVAMVPWLPSMVSAVIDGAFLPVVAGIVWREIIVGGAWDRTPIGGLISLYAIGNILFHVLAIQQLETGFAERMALGLVMILLTLIGGRITPGFTQDFFEQLGQRWMPSSFSRIDGLAILSVVAAALAWTLNPQTPATGWALIIAGTINLVRLARWQGWRTWREPLVLILHVGYGWLAVALGILGGAILGTGIPVPDALHALTAGAVGSMTLAVMTRASLGHTGRRKHAGPLTVTIYGLVNLGAVLRVLSPLLDLPAHLSFVGAAIGWSGAYLLFLLVYGPILLAPSLDED